MRVITFLLAGWLAAPYSNLFAQQFPVQPGHQVRVTAPDCDVSKQTTTLQALRGDTLVLAADLTRSSNPTIDCPAASVTKLEVVSGQKSHLGSGAAIGALAGALLGGVGFYAACSADVAESPSECALIGVLLGGAAGTGLGMLIGANVKTDRWEEVPLNQLRLGVVPQRGGRLAIGVGFAF